MRNTMDEPRSEMDFYVAYLQYYIKNDEEERRASFERRAHRGWYPDERRKQKEAEEHFLWERKGKAERFVQLLEHHGMEHAHHYYTEYQNEVVKRLQQVNDLTSMVSGALGGIKEKKQVFSLDRLDQSLDIAISLIEDLSHRKYHPELFELAKLKNDLDYWVTPALDVRRCYAKQYCPQGRKIGVIKEGYAEFGVLSDLPKLLEIDGAQLTSVRDCEDFVYLSSDLQVESTPQFDQLIEMTRETKGTAIVCTGNSGKEHGYDERRTELRKHLDVNTVWLVSNGSRSSSGESYFESGCELRFSSIDHKRKGRKQ